MKHQELNYSLHAWPVKVPAESPLKLKPRKNIRRWDSIKDTPEWDLWDLALLVGLCHLFPLFAWLISLGSRFFGTWDLSSHPSAVCLGAHLWAVGVTSRISTALKILQVQEDLQKLIESKPKLHFPIFNPNLVKAFCLELLLTERGQSF